MFPTGTRPEPDDLRDVAAIVAGFRLGGELLSVEPWGSGHIHDTYVGRVTIGAGTRRFIHQRINRRIFRQPAELMDNIARVTAHLARRIAAAGGDPLRGTLTLVPAHDGQPFLRDARGDCWRTYRFIEGARSHDAAQGPEHAHQAARTFGRFQAWLTDLPGPRLHETIPGFGDSAARLAAFHRALDRDEAGRAAGTRDEIRFALAREAIVAEFARLQQSGALPERIIHFDTKINNVLVDNATGEAVAVIDLDTVMPGPAVYDFGDAARLPAPLRDRAARVGRPAGRLYHGTAFPHGSPGGRCLLQDPAGTAQPGSLPDPVRPGEGDGVAGAGAAGDRRPEPVAALHRRRPETEQEERAGGTASG